MILSERGTQITEFVTYRLNTNIDETTTPMKKIISVTHCTTKLPKNKKQSLHSGKLLIMVDERDEANVMMPMKRQ